MKKISVVVSLFLLLGASAALADEGPFPTPEQQLHPKIHALSPVHLCCRDDGRGGAERAPRPTPEQQQNLSFRPLAPVTILRSTLCSTEKQPVVAEVGSWVVYKFSQSLHWCWTSNGNKVTTNPTGGHSCWTATWAIWQCNGYNPVKDGGQGQPYSYIRGEFHFTAQLVIPPIQISQDHFASITGRPLGYAVFDWN